MITILLLIMMKIMLMIIIIIVKPSEIHNLCGYAYDCLSVCVCACAYVYVCIYGDWPYRVSAAGKRGRKHFRLKGRLLSE